MNNGNPFLEAGSDAVLGHPGEQLLDESGNPFFQAGQNAVNGRPGINIGASNAEGQIRSAIQVGQYINGNRIMQVIVNNGNPFLEVAEYGNNAVMEMKDPYGNPFARFMNDPQFILFENCTGYFNGGCYATQINAITGVFTNLTGGIAYFDKIYALTGITTNTTVNNITINTQTITGTTLYINEITGSNLWINNYTGTNLYITNLLSAKNENCDIINANSV